MDQITGIRAVKTWTRMSNRLEVILEDNEVHQFTVDEPEKWTSEIEKVAGHR